MVAVSILDSPDEQLLHYDGGIHREDPPAGVEIEPELWLARVREHQELHLQAAIAAVSRWLVDFP